MLYNNNRQANAENIVPIRSGGRPPLSLAPAASRPQPAPPVLFDRWVSARDQVASALLGGVHRIVVTGPAGTGKTVLLDHVARILRAAGRTVIVQQAIADPAPPEHGVTLFVDEADRLPIAKLASLLKDAAGTVVLAGLEPLLSHVGARIPQVTLGRLDHVEAQHYVSGWLALNGRTPAELDAKAVRVLLERSGGVPRLLSTLLAAASWLARSGNEPVIGPLHIEEAAELRSVFLPAPAEGRPTAPNAARRPWTLRVALLALALLSGAALALLPRLLPAETRWAVALAAPVVEQAERWLRPEPRLAPPPPAQASAKPSLPRIIEPAQGVDPTPMELAAIAEPARHATEPPVPEPPPLPSQADASVPLPAAVASPPVAPPMAAPPVPLPVETIEYLLRRGREMLALDDLSAARLLFGRAAEGGSPEAMVELGKTFDPAVRSTVGSPALLDREEALRWYRRAAKQRESDVDAPHPGTLSIH